uniref:Alginate export domain-containing protein n=1 Tax=Candidatus Kentrum sp. LFY TaxID=2126342 RepID=A0A450WY25_9GAMM|nr:MAG: hypothetical protein BECKLFY1418C_GA0070996_110711 [Candidatus Kentron sp. LFY]
MTIEMFRSFCRSSFGEASKGLGNGIPMRRFVAGITNTQYAMRARPPMTTIRRNRSAAILTFVAAQMMAAGAQAVEVRLSGHMEAQVRWFQSSPDISPAFGSENEQSKGAVVSVALEPEWKYLTKDRKHDFKFTPFIRYDAEDRDRTHVDIRELYWMYKGDQWEILAGVDKVRWGVTESHHLVDIINQTDLVEDLDGEDKLGQPMIRLTLDLARVLQPKKAKKDWGKLTAFLMPGFRERTFPGTKGRLRGPLPIKTEDTEFLGGAGKDRVDLALRYSHTIDKWDVGAYYFHGNSREPRLMRQGAYLIPQYELINQVGTDIQYTSGAWLGKFEGIVREGHGDTFGAFAAGVEYTFYQPYKTWDVGLLVEYLHDDRDQNLAPRTTFDNDIFLGTRLSLNDVQNTGLLLGVITDVDSGAYSFNMEAERRISNNISAELIIRLFGAGDEELGDEMYSLRKDDYAQLSVFYHF